MRKNERERVGTERQTDRDRKIETEKEREK